MKQFPQPRNYPPMWVREFRVVVDSSLVGLGYQLRICGADVQIMEGSASHQEIIQVCVFVFVCVCVWTHYNFFCCFLGFFFFFFAFPSYISGVHHFWVRFLRL